MVYFYESERIYLKDEEDKIVGYVLFPKIEENVVEITKTFVSETLRGQGIANELMKRLVKYLEKNNLKCTPSCSYAVIWFDKNEEYKYLLKGNNNDKI